MSDMEDLAKTYEEKLLDELSTKVGNLNVENMRLKTENETLKNIIRFNNKPKEVCDAMSEEEIRRANHQSEPYG
jgi:regulator of replication initiation timing